MSTALAAGPAEVGLDTPAAATVTGTATPLSPIDAAVPGTPVFTVAVTDAVPGQQVHVQFTAGATTGDLYTDAPAGLDDAQVAVPATGTFGDGPVTWRARLTGEHGAGPWSGLAGFAVDTAEGGAELAGEFTVSPAVLPVPHLWHLDPGLLGADTGETVVLIGAGFGTAPRVLLGGADCPVTALAQVSQAAEHATAREITPGGACTPEHQRLTVLIPPVDPDDAGDALTVVQGD